MPIYQKQGEIPQKRHTIFRKPNGELYREELFSTHGFANIYSNKYHHNMPTSSYEVEPVIYQHGENWDDNFIQNYLIDSNALAYNGNFFSARNKIFYNNDVAIYTAKITQNTDEFYRNAYADEMLFMHHGNGTLSSEYGELAFKNGDYLIIPRGTTYQIEFDSIDNVRMFIVESFSMLQIPKNYRNEYGQLLETAPYCERDIRTPALKDAIVEQGKFAINCKFGDRYQRHYLQWHPFDLVGWDGYVYPWAFNIEDFCPIVGKIHLPPSIHLLFTANNFVVCNFVPRLYDFHKDAIPAPYFHSNIDSDEVLYYAHGEFMSRNSIKEGFISLHQKGVAHGPQPGRTEDSIGQEGTYEYAVMVDTFAPLKLTQHVKQAMIENYNNSWLQP